MKKKKKFTIMFGAAIAIALVFIYIGFIREPAPPPAETVAPDRSAPELRTGLFESGILERFNVWNSLPVRVGPTGKSNPFSQ